MSAGSSLTPFTLDLCAAFETSSGWMYGPWSFEVAACELCLRGATIAPNGWRDMSAWRTTTPTRCAGSPASVRMWRSGSRRAQRAARSGIRSDEHAEAADRAVVDLAMNQGPPPPFDPRAAVVRFAAALMDCGVTRVVGDAYTGETFRLDRWRCLPLTWRKVGEDLAVSIPAFGVPRCLTPSSPWQWPAAG
jgi:hypothetical protein